VESTAKSSQSSAVTTPAAWAIKVRPPSRAVRALLDSGCSSAVTVSPTPAHFTPERTLCVNDQGHLRPYREDGLKYTSRQMIPDYFYRNGLTYAVTREGLVDQGRIIQDDTLAVPVERPVVNIDEPLDLAWAEFLLRQPQGVQ